MKIGFYGCGNMGGAILKSLLKKNFTSPQDILVIENTPEKRKTLEKDHAVKTSNNPDELGACDVVFLGIKPQSLPDVPHPDLPHTTLISMLAGIEIRTLKNYFPPCKMVRIMPNLGMSYGSSTTGVFWEKGTLREDEKKWILQALTQGGKVVKLDKEEDFHLFTMLYGSSPAYFLYLAEFLESQGKTFENSHETTTQVLRATLDMIDQNPHTTYADLRSQITSKGGVTHEAIKVMEKNKKIFEEMIQAGIKRSHEIGK